MEVSYCDLCGVPLKDGEQYMLYISKPTAQEQTYFDYLKDVKTETKDVCSTCKKIFDYIFELRLQNLSCLSNELLGIYQLPSYKKEKKNGKKEKK